MKYIETNFAIVPQIAKFFQYDWHSGRGLHFQKSPLKFNSLREAFHIAGAARSTLSIQRTQEREMSNANLPAFPLTEETAGIDYYKGLTKREYFAGLAMQGNLANTKNWASREAIARESVKDADALIAALERKPE